MKAVILRLAVVSALAVGASACGDEDDDATPVGSQPSPTPVATPTPVASPTPSPSPLPGDPSGEITTFAGVIDAIESSTIVNVSDKMVEVDEKTRLTRQQTPISFSDLRVGDHVLVRAHVQRDGTWLATELKVRPE